MISVSRMIQLLVEENTVTPDLVEYVEKKGVGASQVLYRGSWQYTCELVPGNIIEVGTETLSSWSMDKDMAIQFAGSSYDENCEKWIIEHPDLTSYSPSRVVYVCEGIRRGVNIQELLIAEEYGNDFIDEAEWLVQDNRFKVISVTDKRLSIEDAKTGGDEIVGYDYKEVVIEPIDVQECRASIEQIVGRPVIYYPWYAELDLGYRTKAGEFNKNLISPIANAGAIKGVQVCEVYQQGRFIYVKGNEQLYLDYLIGNTTPEK